MRDGEAGLVDRALPEEEQVEVDRARPPARPFAHAAERALDVEQAIEQLARRQVGLQLRDGVQERRLIERGPTARSL